MNALRPANIVLASALVCFGSDRAAYAQLFQTPISHAAAGTSLSGVLGDLNGDGKVDALVLKSLPEYVDGPRWEVRINDGAGNFTLIGVVQSQLDAPVSSRASTADLATLGAKIDQLQTSLPTGASLAAFTQALNAVSTSLTAHQTRLAIEQALARVDIIASFYRPTAHGGQLDLVRSIVVDVVDRSEAAGANATVVSKARRAIAEGDTRKTAGDYRGAYLLYAGAYQAMGGLSR